MKIISLNIWGGKKTDDLLGFFQKYAADTDVFCLQEVFDNGTSTRETFKDANMHVFADITSTLSDFQGNFHPTQKNEEGLAIFVKKSFNVIDVGEIFVHRWKDAMEGNDSKTLGRNMDYVSLSISDTSYLICNLHGLWNGQGKGDTDDRITQSKNVRSFLDSRSETHKILVGDFNLRPETQSVSILELGMRNLVKEFDIKTTRTGMCTRPEIADYALTSQNVIITSFEVLPDEVSDHSPLRLQIKD